ncbi:MAG: glycosyltransferase family 2 protein [Rickettsiales bacterium]|nr:glycosyltransferase family 2 protein [Rickettsiales bacterium]
MIKISAYIITKNEEQRIEKTLIALKQVADEIILVDSGSTDKTIEIAKAHGVKTSFNKWENYSKQKIHASNLCSNDWLLSIDADEELSDDLIAEILEFKKNPKAKICNIKIGQMYPNFKKPRLFARKYNLIRLYHKDFAYMQDDYVHDRIVANEKSEKVFQFKSCVHHHSFISFSQTVQKLIFYTNELNESVKAKKKSYSMLRLITEFPVSFIKYYFIRRECFNGFWGFAMSVIWSFYRFLKIAKYFENKYLKN